MRIGILLGGAALMLAPMKPTIAADVQIVAQNPVIELSVSEQVDSTPDTASFGTGVETKARTATQALRENSRQTKVVMDRLKSLGIASKDIQTTGISVNADYQYDRETRQNQFVGYRVSNQVSATVRDIKRLGAILDAFIASGATNLNGPNFSIADDKAVKKLARERALANAKQRALAYAQSEGYSGVRVLTISEGLYNVSQAPMMARMQSNAAPAPPPPPPPPPIAVGQVGTRVSLSITYEMTR